MSISPLKRPELGEKLVGVNIMVRKYIRRAIGNNLRSNR